MSEIVIRSIEDADRPMLERFIAEHWGAPEMVAHGQMFYPHTLPGFLAFDDGTLVGLITYHIRGAAAEVTSLDSLREGQGIGTALLHAFEQAAKASSCTRLFLITTNDNINALRFYQKRGYVFSALRPNAIAESRRIKPSIPLTGDHGIPIRDEIELEKLIEHVD